MDIPPCFKDISSSFRALSCCGSGHYSTLSDSNTASNSAFNNAIHFGCNSSRSHASCSGTLSCGTAFRGTTTQSNTVKHCQSTASMNKLDTISHFPDSPTQHCHLLRLISSNHTDNNHSSNCTDGNCNSVSEMNLVDISRTNRDILQSTMVATSQQCTCTCIHCYRGSDDSHDVTESDIDHYSQVYSPDISFCESVYPESEHSQSEYSGSEYSESGYSESEHSEYSSSEYSESGYSESEYSQSELEYFSSEYSQSEYSESENTESSECLSNYNMPRLSI